MPRRRGAGGALCKGRRRPTDPQVTITWSRRSTSFDHSERRRASPHGRCRPQRRTTVVVQAVTAVGRRRNRPPCKNLEAWNNTEVARDRGETTSARRYGDKLAVDSLSFAVRPGVVTGFLGPNGAGKSTTMRMIMGLDRPTSGRVRVNGRPYAQHKAPLQEIGALLEAKAIHPGRSAYHHLLRPGGEQRHRQAPGARGHRHGRPDRGGPQAGRRLLAGHGAAAGHRLGAARRPADRHAGRAGQRARPRRRAVDPQPAQEPRRRRGGRSSSPRT